MLSGGGSWSGFSIDMGRPQALGSESQLFRLPRSFCGDVWQPAGARERKAQLTADGSLEHRLLIRIALRVCGELPRLCGGRPGAEATSTYTRCRVVPSGARFDPIRFDAARAGLNAQQARGTISLRNNVSQNGISFGAMPCGVCPPGRGRRLLTPPAHLFPLLSPGGQPSCGRPTCTAAS